MSSAFVEVGHVLRCEIAVARNGGHMQLPYVLEAWRVMQSLIGLECTALFYPVGHDSHTRLECGECRRISDVRPAMMGDQVHIDRSDQVFRTREIE